jgi:hypothetical protein
MRAWLVASITVLWVTALCVSCGEDNGKNTGNETVIDSGTAIDVLQPDKTKPVQPDMMIPIDQAQVKPDLGAVPKCPNEVNLATKTPCDCYGTIVTDVKKEFPDCTKIVKCCPGQKKPVCE